MNTSNHLNSINPKFVFTQCGLEEKLEALQLLEKNTFSIKFKRFLESCQTDELSLEDIKNEVENVRQVNHNQLL